MDPLAELRESLVEEVAGSSDSTAARPQAPSVPPPLPPRKASPATPAAFRPAMSLPSVQGTSRSAEPPAATARPVGTADPFSEPPEPRMPLGSAPEEKLEHFRAVVKQKTETLTRARALYEEREAELQALRVSEATLRRQLMEAREQLAGVKELPAKLEQASAALARESARTAAAEAKVAELEGELQLVEEDRKDLSRSLAEVEAELSRVTSELQHERSSRGSIAEELVGAKEALSLAQDRVAELAAERAEMQGALEAVREQYQANLAELERTGEELRERELADEERAGGAERVAELEAEVASLREALAASEAEVVQLRDRMEADASALGEAAEQAETQVAALRAEFEAAEADRKDLSRSLADVEAELARVQAQAKEEAEYTAAAQSRVVELEAELKTLESDRQDLSRALADVEAELGRAREQAEQRDASEAEEELEVEELDAERRAQEAEEQVLRLRQRVTMLEGALEASRGKNPAPEAEALVRESSEATAGLVAERDQLKEDVAAMKRKLMAAETALETAASYKMKLARLEAQLAQLRGAK
ncbi:coiled-coil domain-containing protein [Archangium lipolyticum]|uniref:hypothetical protein n=1 Tax=Archangium lipolyticum TaxID=2970465 RepID=UPI002149C3BB|nr:hypothetical protein [Archangium lipolyticum]